MPARLTCRRPSHTPVHLCNPIACRQCPAQFLPQHAPTTQPANRACCSTPPTCRCPVCLTCPACTPQHGPRVATSNRLRPCRSFVPNHILLEPLFHDFFPANSSTFQSSFATILFRWFLLHPLPLGTGFPNSMVISSKVKCAGAGKAPQQRRACHLPCTVCVLECLAHKQPLGLRAVCPDGCARMWCTPHVVQPPCRSLHGTSCCPCCRYSASMPALPPARALFLCLPCRTRVAAPPTALKPRCVISKAAVVQGRLLQAQNASHTQDLRTTGWHQFPGPAGPHRAHSTPPGAMHEGKEGPGRALPCKTHPTSAGESGATCASAAGRGLPDPAVVRSSFPSRPSLRAG